MLLSACGFRGEAIAEGPPADAMLVDAGGDAATKFVARINIAGPAFVGVDHPGVWSADPGVGGICNGSVFTAPTMTMHGTNDSPLYRTVMFRNPLSCTIPNVPPGTYRVTLLFAEVFWGGPPCAGAATGSRVFSIALEGTTVLAGYNETVDDGGCAGSGGAGHPVDKTFVISISDGALDIAMAATVDNAALNAIEIVEQ